MLWTYALKAFAEQLNVLKVNDYGISPMEKFTGTSTDISLQKHHTWVFAVYVLDAIFKGNISALPK